MQPVEQRIAELEAMVNELTERLARHEERTEPMSAEVMYQTAKDFIEKNPQAWETMKRTARSRALSNQRVSMKRIIEDARDQYGVQWQTQGFKFNNSVTACLARFLVKECPEVAPKIKMNRSKVDRFFNEV